MDGSEFDASQWPVPAHLPCHQTDIPGCGCFGSYLRRRPMKNKRAYRCLLTRLIGLAASVCLGLIPGLCLGPGNGRAEEAKPPLAVQLLFDRPLEASMAPFIVAENRGLFAAEGLSVRNDFVNGSPEAIARVASGASDFALVDINELIRFRSKADAPPVKAVFVLFNQSPYAFVARKSRGIRALVRLEGKTVGVAEGDLSFHLWPALAKQNGIKTAGHEDVQDERGGARADPVRGPGRCCRGLLLSLGRQPARPRRAGERPRGAALQRLWLRGLWLCRDRQSRRLRRQSPMR